MLRFRFVKTLINLKFNVRRIWAREDVFNIVRLSENADPRIKQRCKQIRLLSYKSHQVSLIDSRVHWSADFFLWFRKTPMNITGFFPPGKEAHSFTCNIFFPTNSFIYIDPPKVKIFWIRASKKSLMWVTCELSRAKRSCQTTGILREFYRIGQRNQKEWNLNT